MRISDWSSDVCSSDLADFGVAEIGMHPFPESIIAIHSVDRVCKAVDKFQQKAFACTEARPLQVDCLRICVKLFFYWLFGKAGPVAPQAHTFADGAANHRRHRNTHNLTFPGLQVCF